MEKKRISPMNLAWLGLVVATLLSVVVGGRSGSVSFESGTSVAVLAITFTKVYVVMHFFMDLRLAPPAWRLVFVTWVLGMFSVFSLMLVL